MMNPEMMKLAMEQMSKMTPDQMADMQRQMGSLTPAQMQAYQQQAANLSPDDITRARTQMNNMTPDQLRQAASQAGANLSAREKYQLDGANSLKASGNQLHSSKQYAAAIDKYNQAKSSLTGQPSEQAKEVRKACMLNICSCRLNLSQFDLCAQECTEVLATDANNRKALYRRGSAYNGLARYIEAVEDLSRALEMSPGNERDVVATKLKEAQDGAAKQPASVHRPSQKTATPSVPASSQTERPSDRDNGAASSSNQQGPSKTVEDGHVSDADSDNVEEIPTTTMAPQQAGGRPTAPSMPAAPMGMPPGMDPAQMQHIMQDPAMMRQMTDMMANMDPAQMESMARMAGAPAGMSVSPEMMKSVSSMMSSMSPEMMQSMMAMASSSGAAAGAPATAAGPSGQPIAPGQGPGGGPQVPPQMMEQMQKHLSNPATADMISTFVQTMKPEDLAGILKQSGMDVTPEQAGQYLNYAKKISPGNMRLLLKASAYGMPLINMGKQAKQFVQQHSVVVWASLLLLLALLLRYFGWV